MAVDVGNTGCADDVEEFIIGELKRGLADLRYITATHFHIDHIGGIAALLKKCPPSTRVLFNHRVGDYIDGRAKISLMKNWRNALYPASWASARYVRKASHLHFETLTGIPLPIIRSRVRLLYGRERILCMGGSCDRRAATGFGKWEMIDTPGHTEDSVSFYHSGTRELICGDFIVNLKKGGHGRVNRFHWRSDTIMETFFRLEKEIKPVSVYPGHGEVIRDPENALRGVEHLS